MTTPNAATTDNTEYVPVVESTENVESRHRADEVATAADNADAAVRSADPFAPENNAPGEDEVIDETPVLAPVATAYDTPANDEDFDPEATVDLSDMPKLRSFEHELPSARFVYVAKSVEIIRLMPEDMLKGGTEVDPEGGFDMSKLQYVSALSEVVPAMEQYVMDMAHDPAEMRAWLIKRGDYNVVMAAFNVAQGHVKN